jgi:hypothetical protein
MFIYLISTDETGSLNNQNISVQSDNSYVSKKFSKKSSVFWDITPCSVLKVSGRFRGTCKLHLQSRRNQREAELGLFFDSE